MTARNSQHHRHKQPPHPFNFAGVLALIFGGSACAACLIIVWRGDPKGIGEWGLLIGNLTTGACGLLSQFSNRGRATDPSPLPGGTMETTTTVSPPPEGEA